jgi:hypothetical protein
LMFSVKVAILIFTIIFRLESLHNVGLD